MHIHEPIRWSSLGVMTTWGALAFRSGEGEILGGEVQ